jgi:hypothetical protein
MGFDQVENKREYRFDCLAKGEPTLRVVITADMALFLKHHVGIQEGPTLCARKLTADFETLRAGTHELTNDDLLAYATARAAADARKAEMRRSVPRRRSAGGAANF